MKFVSKWEWMDHPDGAYTNDPKDPGGETKYGVAKASHPQLDIQHLSLAEAMDVYYKEYWLKFQLDALTFPFSVAVFDCFVQHRINVVQGWLKICPNIQSLLEARRVFYLSLIQKNSSLFRFKNGWLARLNDLSKYCAILQQESDEHPVDSNVVV
jgi:lysozyme family protein